MRPAGVASLLCLRTLFVSSRTSKVSEFSCAKSKSFAAGFQTGNAFFLFQFRVVVDVAPNVTSSSTDSVPITTEPFGGRFVQRPINSNINIYKFFGFVLSLSVTDVAVPRKMCRNVQYMASEAAKVLKIIS